MCTILLTLYLLDSRPLAETLAIFFNQRSRVLSTTASKVDAASPAKPRSGLSRQGSVGKAHAEHKDIRQSIEACLDIITRTANAARAIFQGHETGKSLMTNVLENIQPTANPAGLNTLPPELRLSTQLLLSSLPSSSHFLLLPQTIKSYKPYVDLSSTSSAVPPSVLTQRLQDWFQKSCTEFSQALNTWFSKIDGMKEMWKLRNLTRKWLFDADGLLENERRHLHRIVDDACRERLTSIWTAALRNARSGFEQELKTALGVTLRQPGASGRWIRTLTDRHFGLKLTPRFTRYGVPARCSSTALTIHRSVRSSSGQCLVEKVQGSSPAPGWWENALVGEGTVFLGGLF